ncbi:hypothetical protein H6G36_28895 [Anabaena minutissima FACHB-250]|nr:hypothetical protein [Anabaena minutissima FACHB-250]
MIESGTGKLTEKFTEAAIAKANDPRKKILERLKGKSDIEQPLAAIQQGLTAELSHIEPYLQIEMNKDPQFADEVRQLAQEIHAGKIQDNSSMTQNNYDNAKGWQTKVEGGTAYIGDVRVYQGKTTEDEGK